jgi:hypothetical protein
MELHPGQRDLVADANEADGARRAPNPSVSSLILVSKTG